MRAPTDSRVGEAWLTRLVSEHQAGLFRYLLFLGCDHALAEDLVQETFVTAWERPPEIRGARETSAWLRTVARNRFYSLVRRRKTRPAIRDLDEADAVWSRLAGDDGGRSVLEALSACLEGLTDRVRDVLDRFYRDRCSRADIAREAGMTENGVKTLLRRTRARLRDCVAGRLDR